MVICLERGADLHMAQLMPLPLTVSCFNKIQSGFTFLVPADLGSPGKGPLNGCMSVISCRYLLPAARSVQKMLTSVWCNYVLSDEPLLDSSRPMLCHILLYYLLVAVGNISDRYSQTGLSG